MYQALYRKYRPQTFDDIVGQLAVTQTLKMQLSTNKLSHAYLFTGSRGTGKTSCAKILAKAVNCENPHDGNPCNCCASCRAIDSGACMDVLEIDAASNNGVDNVRDLRDDAIYTPSQVRMRVYIIDEVHMLSISAFNALLKIIEEPPEYLLFILATTELHKVPATILSRCQRFAFRRISQQDIAARLQFVAYQEDIDLDDGAARVLARLADGGMRDGLSLLDQCASATSGELSAERVYACLGLAGLQESGKLMECIALHNTTGALSIMNRLYADGKDLSALMDELLCLTRDLLILKTVQDNDISMLSGVASDKELLALKDKFSTGELSRIMNLIRDTVVAFGKSTNRRMDAELCIVNLCQPELETDMDAVLARLTKLEEQIASGNFTLAAPAKPAIQINTAEQEQIPKEEPAVIVEEEPEITEPMVDQAPAGFWTDVAAAVRKELMPPASGFFATTPNAPLYGTINGDKLYLVCANKFTVDIINKPDILELVARKATAKLGYPVRVIATDESVPSGRSAQMEQLLNFGKTHNTIVTIKED